jgi:protocatechuate 3,4-dioxygenase beta subunit
MKRLLALAVFIFSVLPFAGAQSPASAARLSSIAGTVIKQRGSEPLKKVLVQVIAENQKEGGNYTASTDADGHFHIDDVEPGRYRIFLERSGFIAVNDRGQKADMNVFTIRAGQALENVFFRMLPMAVISGRITDEDGDPMPDARVIAQMKKPGRIKHESVATAATNDLGEYRLSGLFPGQYLIVATPPPDFRDYEKTEKSAQPASSTDTQSVQGSAQGSAPPSGPQPETRYLTTYYPGTFDAAQASVLAVKAGDDMPVNLTLVPARTYRVRGMVTGVPTRQKPSVELISKAGDSYRANASEIGPDGQFEVRGVAPGSYLLIAKADSPSQSLSARQDINVVSGDIEGVKLTPQPSFTLSGHLRIEGVRSESNAIREPVQYAVNLRPAALAEDSGVYVSQDFFGINASVDRLGNFEWKDVTPGNYIVQVFGGDGRNGFFLKSVQMGGRDVATGFMASGPSFVDLVVGYAGGTIEGTVTEREGENYAGGEHPAPNATVEAAPEEKYRMLPDHFAIGATDQNGRFTIQGLAPGNYLLYAWQNVDESVYRDPDFLKSQEANGFAVKVEENSHQQVELKVSAAPAEWQ